MLKMEESDLIKSDPSSKGEWKIWWRRVWQKTREGLATAWGFVPLTALGVVYLLLLGVTFYFIALGQRDIVWITASIALGVVGILMVLAVVLGAIQLAWVWRERCQEGWGELHVQCGASAWSDLQLPIWPIPFIEITTQWIYPRAVEVENEQGWTQLRERLQASHRCSVEHVTRRLQVRDILGLASISWVSAQNCSFKAYPRPGKLERSNVTLSLSSGEDLSDPYGSPQGDLIEMRQYVPGDSSRSILWKVYARNRKLMVRMPERALTAKPRTCAYLVAGPHDEASASFAYSILSARLLGENWGLGADGCVGIATSMAQALDFLANSGNEEITSCGLAPFLAEAAAKGYHNCFVFVPSAPGPWLLEAQRAIKETSLTITWFIGYAHDLEALVEEKPWERYLWMDAPSSQEPSPAQVGKTLYTPRTPVILCEQSSGRLISNLTAYFQSRQKAG